MQGVNGNTFAKHTTFKDLVSFLQDKNSTFHKYFRAKQQQLVVTQLVHTSQTATKLQRTKKVYNGTVHRMA
jgi:hypothetical protein